VCRQETQTFCKPIVFLPDFNHNWPCPITSSYSLPHRRWNMSAQRLDLMRSHKRTYMAPRNTFQFYLWRTSKIFKQLFSIECAMLQNTDNNYYSSNHIKTFSQTSSYFHMRVTYWITIINIRPWNGRVAAQNLVMFGEERCARERCSMEWESAGERQCLYKDETHLRMDTPTLLQVRIK